MAKQKKGPLALILVVIALTIYNILPTLFYYSKPLKEPLNEVQGMKIAFDIVERLNSIEQDALDWARSYCDLLRIQPVAITLDKDLPQLIHIQCTKVTEAERLRRSIERAGALIPFVPAQLSPLSADEPASKTVTLLRRIPLHIEETQIDQLFAFAPKGTPLYNEWILDRAATVAAALTNPTKDASLFDLAARINEFSDLFSEKPAILSRFCSNLTREPLDHLFESMDALRDRLKQQKTESFKESSLTLAEAFLKKHRALCTNKEPLTLNYRGIADLLKYTSTIPLHSSPFFSEFSIDWEHNMLSLTLHPDLVELREQWTGTPKDRLEQLFINEIARITSYSDEIFILGQREVTVQLHHLANANGFVILKLDPVAEQQINHLIQLIKTHWHPQHPDLLPEHFPIVDEAGFTDLSDLQKNLCLYIESKKGSIAIVAKGLDRILAQVQRLADAESTRLLQEDFNSLSDLLRRNGFATYSSTGEIAFENPNAFSTLLFATREEFQTQGSKKFAVLECSNLEQRLLTKNRIETRIHEDLLKWRDEYTSTHVTEDSPSRFDVPKPTRSIFWSNLCLSMKKYLRGDDRKILRWGLDLSGGKSVQIELRDNNHRLVQSDSDLKQGINELFNRVNKMGVSDVSIRQVGTEIVLDFPGSQALTATELVKASSMSFHVVNEQFSSQNPLLADVVHRFLQDVWNEAIVTNRKDPQNINAIAWKHLSSDSEAARVLHEAGLRLQPPDDLICSSAVDDSLSKIAIVREQNWNSETHPLLIVFANYALEGSNLSNIRSSYDPSKGNFLSFEIKGSAHRDELYAWTSQFSKERIQGTPNETYSHGQGWRMAVILNDSVISAPTLQSALRDSAMISGSFTQREANQLASDLKAGSLTFTPHILSEKNVSPELGQSDRAKGLLSAAVALLLVIGSMLCYYRFAGLVASVAVLFNLLIMWATLQNLQATLSLAGIAGIILTVGMAIDANVLVFERIKEEFALTGRLASSIETGYKKAFSAILDSNITTIIAALILLNFDAGPIKGFAITLIIGIASSMFTALFMTRIFFSYWLQNPANKILKMADWIRSSSFNFLKKAPWAFATAASIIIIGGTLLFSNRATVFGMDFTGGFTTEIEVAGSQITGSVVDTVTQAFLDQGISSHDFQIRELHPSNHLRLLFSTKIQQNFQELGHRQWIVDALAKHNLSLTPASLSQIDTNWISMSGQMSENMRNNALIGLGIAFAFIFIYLVIRFEATYATSAIICLLHDVFITLGIMGILHALHIPIQIDLNTIAALMTIVGYSLNDTIIIFDRIREEVKGRKGESLVAIVNHALNATLSRTSITSGTTLFVILALVFLGGSSIFSFALVMTIGVVCGTLSSWFIAAPLMIYFHNRSAKKEKAILQIKV